MWDLVEDFVVEKSGWLSGELQRPGKARSISHPTQDHCAGCRTTVYAVYMPTSVSFEELVPVSSRSSVAMIGRLFLAICAVGAMRALGLLVGLALAIVVTAETELGARQARRAAAAMLRAA